MWFLLLQILLLLLLAALFGGLLAYWWFRRRYEDVTISYESMAGQTTDLSPLDRRMHDIEKAIGNIKPPAFPDIPATDFSPVQSRLSGIESSLASLGTATARLENTDIGRLERQMDIISSAISDRRETDLTPVEERLSSLEKVVRNIALPETDLGPIHSGLTRVEMSLSNLDIPEIDVSALESRIHALHENVTEHRKLDINEKDELHKRITGISTGLGDLRTNMSSDVGELRTSMMSSFGNVRTTDLSPLDQRLDDIETRIAHISIPEPDLRVVDEGLGIIHGRLSNLETKLDEQSRQQGDMAFLQQRVEQMQTEVARLERMELKLASMQNDIQAVRPNLDPLEQRMIMVQNELGNQTDPDLSPILNSVYAMEQRMDFAAMENRLTSIEYGLAALHHMMRTRQSQSQVQNQDTSYRAPQPSYSTPARTAPPPPQFQAPPASNPTPPPPNNYWAEQMPMPRPFDVPDMPERSGYDYIPEPAPKTVARDAVSAVRRPDDKANLLVRPAFGAPDDLEEISGVGPMLHGLLTEIGVYYFWQVSEWGPAEIEWVDSMLDGFNGRIERDDWVGQAKILATGEHAAKRP